MILTLWLGLALASEPMSLDAAFEAARTAPDASLAHVESERGRAERLESGAWTNPSFDYQGYGRTKGTSDAINGQQHQVDLGIALPITGELVARLRRGRVAEQLGDARATSRYALLAEAVGQAWLELLAAQDREEVLAEASRRLTGLVDLTESRAAEGAARRWDVDRMRLARVALDRQLALARRERKVAAAALSGLLGRAGDPLTATGDLRARLGVEPVLPVESPFVMEAQVVVEHRDLAAREARRSRIPEPELRIGGYWTTDGDSSSVVAGIGWDLPVFDRGQGRVAAAQAERFAADAEARRVEAWVVSERAAVLSAMDDLRLLADASPVPEGDVLTAAEVAWTEGEASILELVDAVAAEVEQRLDAVDVQLALRLLELRLATLDGALTDRVMPL
jgi:cobalt-zinc-cadmium efflux system outer membrane protein